MFGGPVAAVTRMHFVRDPLAGFNMFAGIAEQQRVARELGLCQRGNGQRLELYGTDAASRERAFDP